MQGNSVIDYIISDQNFYYQIKKFKTWQEEFSIVSDHRILTIEVESRGEVEKCEREREQQKKGRGGWKRKIVNRENLEQNCETHMKRWCEEYGEGEKYDSEKAWQTWLETHNKIAEEAIGRCRKKKSWLKGEWDQGLFEAVREKNRLRREMGRVSGERRQRVVEEFREWRQVVKRIVVAKKKRKQQEINEKLENFGGRDEKEYWRYLKNLAGMEKKEKGLPGEVRVGEWMERGEKRKEVWNEAFCKLGKFDAEDKNFDKKAYVEIKQEVEKWESGRGEEMDSEGDGDIEMEELERALTKAAKGKAAGEDGCINESFFRLIHVVS